MPTKLIVQLACLLCLFILLNAGVKWVLIPELSAIQTEKQLKHQENIGSVLMDMPHLGDYIDALQKEIEKNNQSKLNRKSKLYAIEQQLKDQLQYFLQKQILSASQVLIKKEPDLQEKVSFTNAPAKIPEFENTPIEKKNTNHLDPAPSYFNELSEQLNSNQIDKILTTFQEHLKKMTPILNRMEIEILQYDKSIPPAVIENTNYLTDFHYHLSENKDIHLAFLSIIPSQETSLYNIGAIRGIKSFYHIDVAQHQATSLLSHVTVPAIEWKSIKSTFPNEKGHRITNYSDTVDTMQMWHWQQPGVLTVLELYWPTTKNHFVGSILYDFVLLFFLILIGIWFYFYHDSQSNEKNNIILPEELALLKKEKKQLENLLIDQVEKNHKIIIPEIKSKKNSPENIFDDETKKSYLLPTEQTYLDSKIDLKKETRDILMEESQTELLKTLVKKIREGI